MSELQALLEPHDSIYDEDAAVVRMRGLTALYAQAERNDNLAAALITLVHRRFWAWLALLVWTRDEKGVRLRVKPFAPLKCYQVLSDWADERQPDGTWKRPLLAIDKSRQLMMSWWSVCRLYWIGLQKPHGACPMLSKNEDDAKILVDRLKTLHELMPNWYARAMALSRTVLHTERIVLPNMSIIQALPQRGGDAFRGQVPSAWLADEAGFQSDFERNFTAIKGTSDNRTQGIMITTAQASFFQKIIEDRQDGTPGERETGHTSQGLTLWRNGRNQVDCARIHYTADPARRSLAWKQQAKRGMSLYQWRQEQEIDYSSRGGQPVFKMLDRQAHMMRGAASVLPLGKGEWGLRVEGYKDAQGNPIIRPVQLARAIDHGTTNFCACVWVAIDEDFDWTVYRVYKKTGWYAPENGRAIMNLSGQWAEGDIAETYTFDVIDAMGGLPDQRGRVEDIYRALSTPDGRQPMATLEAVNKGAGSRQAGLDLIAGMLHATLAIEHPTAPYWQSEEYEAEHVASFTKNSALYLAPGTEPLYDEMDAARYDQRAGGDPLMAQPETTVDMMDDCLDCLRYITRAAHYLIRNIVNMQKGTGGRWKS